MLVVACLCATVLAAPSGRASSQAELPRPERARSPDDEPARVRRVVLALSTALREDRGSSQSDHVREALQLPIEHLGAVVLPLDARAPRPPRVDWSDVRAVLTSFRAGDRVADWVLPWLERARREHDVRFVHFGSFASLALEPARLDAWLRGFGCRFDGASAMDPVQIEVLPHPARELRYEGAQERQRTHGGPRSVDPNNTVWLRTQLRKPRRQDRDPRAPIVTGPWGGIALEPYALTVGGADFDRRWHVDPFAFFAEALGLRGVPCADPNVFSGRRAFFFHVDGDGFESQSTVASPSKAQVNCGQVFRERILEKYELPMSLSVIVASLTDDLAPSVPSANMELARAIFADPKVEVASHTVLHPLDWRRKLTPKAPPRTVNWFAGLENYEHSMVDEVRRSIRFVNEWLVPEGKRCALLFWSGQANPDEATLRAVRDAGCLNLNGGVSRWDALTNSMAYVRPRGRRVGDEYQVYCGAPNENVYAGFFTTMPGAFWHVDQTLENCGCGRILKPANIYAHFYSAERPARLAALERLLDKWGGGERETAIVFASAYVRAVLGAREEGRVLARARGWSLRGFERCRTLRLEDDERPIDWAASHGVIGEHRIGRARYFTLGAADAELVFAPSPQRALHLVSANHALLEAQRTSGALRLRSRAWSPRELLFGGLEGLQELTVLVDGEERRARADAQGLLTLRLPAGGDSIVEVRVP